MNDAELDLLRQAFKTEPVLMTKAQIAEVERVLTDADALRMVRAALATLTRTGSELLDAMHTDPRTADVYAKLVDGAHVQAALLCALADALRVAGSRLEVALCDASQLANRAGRASRPGASPVKYSAPPEELILGDAGKPPARGTWSPPAPYEPGRREPT